MWTPSPAYPDPAVEILDERFRDLVLANAAVERLAQGLRWAEGPVWFGDHRCLLWSDIPNDRILRFDEATNAVTTFRTGGHANGNTRDRQGRLISCLHGRRAVVRTEHDGRLTVLADRFLGKRLNSPNDVVVKSDGSIWFSDPLFGIASFYEGGIETPELPTNVYRIDGESGELTCVIEGIEQPNGVCFSPDERRLYVVESGARPRRIHVFDVSPDGLGVSGGRVFITAEENGSPDGFRCDVRGNLWAGWGSPEFHGVRVYAPDGTVIGQIRLPERCANLCFGGLHRTRLFMAASQSLYALHVKVQGAGYF